MKKHPPNTLLICRGSDCRKRRAERRAIESAVDKRMSVTYVGCQKICRGPVVGLYVDGVLEWFKEVATDKARAALRVAATGGALEKPLRKRHIKKRSGKLRS